MPEWEMLHPDTTVEHLGYLPGMLNLNDPRRAREQFDSAFHYGGGWDPFPGFILHGGTLIYPGDPPIAPLARCHLRDELILFYPHSWVLVMQPDKSWEVARMD